MKVAFLLVALLNLPGTALVRPAHAEMGAVKSGLLAAYLANPHAASPHLRWARDLQFGGDTAKMARTWDLSLVGSKVDQIAARLAEPTLSSRDLMDLERQLTMLKSYAESVRLERTEPEARRLADKIDAAQERAFSLKSARLREAVRRTEEVVAPGSARSDEEVYDVIVVGGGPAGATAARHAALLGLKVAVVDSSEFPRDKTCGWFVSKRAEKALDFSLAGLPQTRPLSGKVRLGLTAVEASRPEMGTLIPRVILDDFLVAQARNAGATFIPPAKVKELTVLDDGVTVTTVDNRRLTGRFVIGADGVNGMTHRGVRPQAEKADLLYALMAETPAKGAGGALEIVYGYVARGYAWIFPGTKDLTPTNAGLGGFGLKKPKEELRRFLKEIGVEGEPTIKGHRIPNGARFLGKPKAADRILLAGDAAGFADPLLGEGIAYAILSGRIAAEVAFQALRTPQGHLRENLRIYEDLTDAWFASDFQYAEQIVDWLAGPVSKRIRIFDGLINLLNWSIDGLRDHLGRRASRLVRFLVFVRDSLLNESQKRAQGLLECTIDVIIGDATFEDLRDACFGLGFRSPKPRVPKQG